MSDLFQMLKPFIFPKYLEEGPPRHIQSMLLGDKLFLGQFGDNTCTRTIMELMTFGYRPVTTMAILKVLLEDSGNHGLHGMEIGRELERRFGLDSGYFTRGRFYSDRVGKALFLLVRLGLVVEAQEPRNGSGGRKYPGYRIEESARDIVKSRLDMVTNEQLSIFATGNSLVEVRDPTTLKTCPSCRFVSRSSDAVYCQRCRSELTVKCGSCGAMVLAHFRYCNNCRSEMTILVRV